MKRETIQDIISAWCSTSPENQKQLLQRYETCHGPHYETEIWLDFLRHELDGPRIERANPPPDS